MGIIDLLQNHIAMVPVIDAKLDDISRQIDEIDDCGVTVPLRWRVERVRLQQIQKKLN